jgi:hypothetical protein
MSEYQSRTAKEYLSEAIMLMDGANKIAYERSEGEGEGISFSKGIQLATANALVALVIAEIGSQDV